MNHLVDGIQVCPRAGVHNIQAGGFADKRRLAEIHLHEYFADRVPAPRDTMNRVFDELPFHTRNPVDRFQCGIYGTVANCRILGNLAFPLKRDRGCCDHLVSGR